MTPHKPYANYEGPYSICDPRGDSNRESQAQKPELKVNSSPGCAQSIGKCLQKLSEENL